MKKPSLKLIEMIYASSEGVVTNEELYTLAQNHMGIEDAAMEAKVPFGEAGVQRSKIKHEIRWFQQTLKAMNVIEKVDGRKGQWQYCRKTKDGVNEARVGAKLLAFSTELGAAIYGDSLDVFTGNNETISLCVTSPPYPLRNQRSYGLETKNDSEYIDFICRVLEPIVKSLSNGASVVMNIGTDIFMNKSPARSLYPEKLVLALHENLGLFLMDRIPWVNRAKPVGPTYWACVERVQLAVAHEPIYWFTNNPHRVKSDNRRVLLPHHEAQRKLVESGGAHRITNYGDGAHQLRTNSFSKETPGRIPKNVLGRGNQCSDSRAVHRFAREMGLPAHPAMFPTDIPAFFIQFLTEVGELVVDPFGGALKTGLAAERLNRRWLCCDKIFEWLKVSSRLFSGFNGFSSSQFLDNFTLE
ncbi:DNA-methyltransferase (plasmid) [Rahnella aceris]